MQDLTWHLGSGVGGARLLQTESAMPACCESVIGNVFLGESHQGFILRCPREESFSLRSIDRQSVSISVVPAKHLLPAEPSHQILLPGLNMALSGGGLPVWLLQPFLSPSKRGARHLGFIITGTF